MNFSQRKYPFSHIEGTKWGIGPCYVYTRIDRIKSHNISPVCSHKDCIIENNPQFVHNYSSGCTYLFIHLQINICVSSWLGRAQCKSSKPHVSSKCPSTMSRWQVHMANYSFFLQIMRTTCMFGSSNKRSTIKCQINMQMITLFNRQMINFEWSHLIIT